MFLPEPGDSGAGARLKWLASTCLAGMVGICVIGVSVYASMNMDDGTGMVASIKRASLAAMEPVRKAHTVTDSQKLAGQKGDRIKTTERGLATRHIIHDTVVGRRGSRDYIGIKPYARVVTRLSTAQPDDIEDIPAFNPFKLYANTAPLGEEEGVLAEGGEGSRHATITVTELDGRFLPAEDGLEMNARAAELMVAQNAELFRIEPFAMRGTGEEQPLAAPDAQIYKASYSPEELRGPAFAERAAPPNTTVVEKLPIEAAEPVIEGIEVKAITVKRGDTLMSILADNGAERWQAKAIAEAMAPVFLAKSLQAGQEVRFTLAPAPSDTGAKEPVKVSLFAGDRHEVTVARNDAGEFVVSEEPIELADAKTMRAGRYPERATLYTSFYHAALNQGLPHEMIMRMLRVHSYDTDFKQRVRAGDTVEVFFDLEDGEDGQKSKPGELLYTAVNIAGETRKFYRFRTPDGTVDFYDAEGNSAKKFLMRKPVKGARFTSGFGMRRHPILGYRKMHTGTDWAAPSGTPILAGGNGIVEAAGRKGGYGNYVRIRHANGYKTAYGHMARFAEGMRPGIKVRQGQVIGYVGSTGLSSGPHLHYEVLVNSRHVNPMTIHVPRGRQLTERELAEFQKERTRIDELMRRSPVTTRVASAAPAHR